MGKTLKDKGSKTWRDQARRDKGKRRTFEQAHLADLDWTRLNRATRDVSKKFTNKR